MIKTKNKIIPKLWQQKYYCCSLFACHIHYVVSYKLLFEGYVFKENGVRWNGSFSVKFSSVRENENYFLKTFGYFTAKCSLHLDSNFVECAHFWRNNANLLIWVRRPAQTVSIPLTQLAAHIFATSCVQTNGNSWNGQL